MNHPDTIAIETSRLRLVPLAASDATGMVEVLADRDLYAFTGGEPPSIDELAARYEAQVRGPDRDGETWHNWIVHLTAADAAVGYVQATVIGEHADVAWVIGTAWQRMGIAREASIAMCRWLQLQGSTRVTAHIHPDHAASASVALACGLAPTDDFDHDGERIWEWTDAADGLTGGSAAT
jgi:RimJ/RimL family protein N-acetyltransferase